MTQASNTPIFVPGIIPAPFDPRDQDYQVRFSLEDARRLPETWDGKKNYPPLPDQGRWGSCAANAGAVEMQRGEMAKHRTGLGAEPLSRAELYDQTRLAMGTFPRDSGSDMRTLCKVLQKQGIALESEFPYTDRNLSIAPTQDVVNLGANRKLLSYHSIAQTKSTYMGLSHSNIAGIIGIAVYSSMLTSEVARTGIVPIPGTTPGDRLEGYHCIGIGGGYNATHLCCPNWWGSNWGDGGFAWLPWELVLSPKLNIDAYAFNVVQ